MAVSKRLRYEILRRDNYTCRYCGAKAPDVPLRVDHVTPVALGGSDDPTNLATSCHDCNAGKTSSSPDATLVADVADGALRWAAAMEQAADVLLRQDEPKVAYREVFVSEWNRWGYGEGDDRKKIELPSDWKAGLERFRVAGLPDWAWAEIVDASMGNKKVKHESKFKYCCGIAWNQVTVIQHEARRLVGASASTAAPRDSTADAIVAVVLAVWTEVTGEDPQPDQHKELVRTALASYAAEREAEDIVRASRQAAYFGQSSIDEGFEGLARDEQFRAYINWQNAWTATGEVPPNEAFTPFWETCERLFAAGVGLPEVKTAAFVAGYHRSTAPHYGIPGKTLRALDIHPTIERATDAWKRAFYGSAGRWPEAGEERKFRAQLERLADCVYRTGDALNAAISAGAVQEADIYWNMPHQLSALFAAALPFDGSKN